MELQWYNYVFTAIPESIIMICLGLTVLDIKITKNKRKILLFSILYSTYISLLWDLYPLYEFRILLNSTIFFLLSWLIFHLSIIYSLIITIAAFTGLIVCEYIVLIIIQFSTGDIKPWLEDPIKRVMISCLYLIPMFIIVFKISQSTYRLPRTKLRGRKLYILLLIMISLAQIFILIYFVYWISFLDNKRGELFSVYGIIIYILLVVLFSVLTIIILKKWYEEDRQQAVLLAEETIESQLNSLITFVRSHSHDLNNHLMVLQGLIKDKQWLETQNYIDTLIKDVNITNSSIQLKKINPILAALVYAKSSFAQKQEINFQFYIDENKSLGGIIITDLIRLLSNLIDNAFEATLELPKFQRNVSVNITRKINVFLIKVVNNTKPLNNPEEIMFFKQQTTKKNTIDKPIRGVGLGIVNEVTKKYGGTIDYGFQDNKVVVSITIPV